MLNPSDDANPSPVQRGVVLLDTGAGPAFSEVAVRRIAEQTGHRFVSAPDRLAKVSAHDTNRERSARLRGAPVKVVQPDLRQVQSSDIGRPTAEVYLSFSAQRIQ
jgi:fumarate hydratase class II